MARSTARVGRHLHGHRQPPKNAARCAKANARDGLLRNDFPRPITRSHAVSADTRRRAKSEFARLRARNVDRFDITIKAGGTGSATHTPDRSDHPAADLVMTLQSGSSVEESPRSNPPSSPSNRSTVARTTTSSVPIAKCNWTSGVTARMRRKCSRRPASNLRGREGQQRTEAAMYSVSGRHPVLKNDAELAARIARAVQRYTRACTMFSKTNLDGRRGLQPPPPPLPPPPPPPHTELRRTDPDVPRRIVTETDSTVSKKLGIPGLAPTRRLLPRRQETSPFPSRHDRLPLLELIGSN